MKKLIFSVVIAIIFISDVFSFSGTEWDSSEIRINSTLIAVSGHTMVSFNDKLWILGGKESSFTNNVYVSDDDGITWSQIIVTSPFPARSYHTSVIFTDPADGKEKIWIIGGFNNDEFSDVWNSEDGITWTLIKDSADFGGVYGHTSLVYDNKMWVIGGQNKYAQRRKSVYSSTDGINWNLVTSTAEFDNRSQHASVVHNGKMWVIGGLENAWSRNDVWSSPDGATWTQSSITSSSIWSERAYHTCTSFMGKIWLVGGYASGHLSDIWFSADGSFWEKAGENYFSARNEHAAVIHNEKLFISGGNSTTNAGDVWFSRIDDSQFYGTEWEFAGSFPADISYRTMFTINNHLYATVLGGNRLDFYLFDESSRSFQQQFYMGNFTQNLSGTKAFPFNGNVYWLGGKTTYTSPVLKCPNAVSFHLLPMLNNASTGQTFQWFTEITGVPFSKRIYHAACEFNGALYVIGGQMLDASGVPTIFLNDIWNSSNGESWNEVTTTGGLPARAYREAVVHNGKIWLLGGMDETATDFEVWNSANGIDWVQVTAAASVGYLKEFSAHSFDGKLWVIGGVSDASGTQTSNIWSSEDGITWTLASSDSFEPRKGHSAGVFDNRIYIVGGNGASDAWRSASFAPSVSAYTIAVVTTWETAADMPPDGDIVIESGGTLTINTDLTLGSSDSSNSTGAGDGGVSSSVDIVIKGGGKLVIAAGKKLTLQGGSIHITESDSSGDAISSSGGLGAVIDGSQSTTSGIVFDAVTTNKVSGIAFSGFSNPGQHAVDISSATVEFENCLFITNSTGLNINSGTVTITTCLFDSNTSEGMNVTAGSVTISPESYFLGSSAAITSLVPVNAAHCYFGTSSYAAARRRVSSNVSVIPLRSAPVGNASFYVSPDIYTFGGIRRDSGIQNTGTGITAPAPYSPLYAAGTESGGIFYVYGITASSEPVFMSYNPLSLSWTTIDVPSPNLPLAGKTGFSMHASASSLWLYGKETGIIYSYDTATAARGESAVLYASKNSAAVSYNNNLYIYGGTAHETSLEMFDGTVFSLVSTAPWGRTGAAITVDNTGKIYIFGGRDSSGILTNTLISYDTTTSIWTQETTGELIPPARENASLFFDTAGSLILHGGIQGCGLADTYTYNPATGIWTLKSL